MDKPRRPLFAWSHWLARHVPAPVVLQMENIVANGPDFVRENLEFVHERIGNEPGLAELFFETACYVAGDAKALDRSTRALSEKPPTEESAMALWCERTFLKGFASYRLGKEDLAKQCWQKAISLAPHSERNTLSARVNIERVAVLQNRGLLQTATFELEGVVQHQEDHLDAFSMARTLSLLILAWNNLGRFDDAWKALEQRRLLVEDIPSVIFKATQARARTQLLLATGRLSEAITVVDEILPELRTRPVLHIVMEQLRIRAWLEAGRTEEAKREVAAMKQRAQEQSLSPAVVASVEDEAYLALREHRFVDLTRHIGVGLAAAAERSDLASRCKLLGFAAQAAVIQGQWEAAERALLEGESIASVQNYADRQLLLAASRATACHARREISACRAQLARGRQLANECGLAVWAAMFAYVDALWHDPSTWFERCMDLLAHSDAGLPLAFPPVLEHALSSSQLSMHEREEAPRLTGEAQVRHALAQRTTTVFWVPGPVLALVRRGHGEALRLDPSLQRDDVVLALVQSPAGLEPQVLHARSSRTPFHPLKHGERVRSLIHQTRSLLKRVGAQIEWDRTAGRYKIVTKSGLMVLTQARSRTGGRMTFQEKLDEVRQALLGKDRTPTQELCQNLAMSRQALRPYLKTLLDAGEIRLVKRGPLSYYIRAGLPRTRS